MIGRQNRHPSVPWNARREPVRHALRHASEFGERNALHRLLALNLQRNIVRELPGRFLESLIERGHSPQEILQEIELPVPESSLRSNLGLPGAPDVTFDTLSISIGKNLNESAHTALCTIRTVF